MCELEASQDAAIENHKYITSFFSSTHHLRKPALSLHRSKAAGRSSWNLLEHSTVFVYLYILTFFPLWFGAAVFVCKSFKTATSLERSLVICLGLNPHCSPAQKTFPLSLETWLFSLRPLSYQAGKQHQAMSARNFNCVCSLAYASGKIILYSTTRPLSFVHSNSLDFNLLRLFDLQRMKSDLLVCPRQCPTCMAYRLC